LISVNERLNSSVWLLLAIACLAFSSLRAETPDRVELEARLDSLRAEIEDIRHRLDRALGERDQALDLLARSDRAVSEAERVRRRTLNEIELLNEQLETLRRQQEQIAASVSDSARLLSTQLSLAYRQGGQSRLKLLLNQEDLRQLNRQLAYHGYLTRARVSLMDDLSQSLRALNESQQALELRQTELAALAERQQVEIETLGQARQAREQALSVVESRIRTDQQVLVELEQDAAELAALLDQLATALADIPPEIEVPAFADLRGQLPMPINGQLAYRFGDHRAGDLSWNGWLIRAAQGADVQAIAYGRVAYADWLRGYGLILIIDHGDGFMSLYAHNEALLRDVGDWVGPGDAIATIGNSGNSSENGLYFELRRNGQPINPAAWLSR
jgi:murein hydrolase activator